MKYAFAGAGPTHDHRSPARCGAQPRANAQRRARGVVLRNRSGKAGALEPRRTVDVATASYRRPRGAWPHVAVGNAWASVGLAGPRSSAQLPTWTLRISPRAFFPYAAGGLSARPVHVCAFRAPQVVLAAGALRAGFRGHARRQERPPAAAPGAVSHHLR